MRISLQFFANLGVNENGETIIGPPAPPDNLSYGNPFLDWFWHTFDPKGERYQDSTFNPPWSFDLHSSTNSAGSVTSPADELNAFDPSSWANLIEDYYDKVEDYNLAAEERANAFSSAEAQKARDWSEFMSSTAYQRAVADLKKAGINPMALFYGRVSPAGNYTSSAASATSHSMAQPNFSAASSVSSSLISAISDVATSLIDALARLIPNFSNATSNVTSNSTSNSSSNSIIHNYIHKGK